MRRTHPGIALILAGGLATSGCYGSFNLCRRLHGWNAEVASDKWEQQFIFLVLTFPWIFFPGVYAVTGLADIFVVNVIEFWTGQNPIKLPYRYSATPQERAGEFRITRLGGPAGEAVLVEQLEGGQPVRTVRVQHQGQVTVATDEAGHRLVTAQTLPDGSLVVTDAAGRSSWHAASEVRRIVDASRQSH